MEFFIHSLICLCFFSCICHQERELQDVLIVRFDKPHSLIIYQKTTSFVLINYSLNHYCFNKPYLKSLSLVKAQLNNSPDGKNRVTNMQILMTTIVYQIFCQGLHNYSNDFTQFSVIKINCLGHACKKFELGHIFVVIHINYYKIDTSWIVNLCYVTWTGVQVLDTDLCLNCQTRLIFKCTGKFMFFKIIFIVLSKVKIGCMYSKVFYVNNSLFLKYFTTKKNI